MNENETRKTNYAAIDIGSNAVRLLIKEIKEEQGKAHFSKVLMLRVPLRLGFDVFDIGKISEKKEKNMIRLMKAFRHLMKDLRCKTLPCMCYLGYAWMPRTVWISSNR